MRKHINLHPAQWVFTLFLCLSWAIGIENVMAQTCGTCTCTYTANAGSKNWDGNSGMANSWTRSPNGAPCNTAEDPGEIAGTCVVIPNGATMTLNVSPANTINCITVQTGGTLTIADGVSITATAILVTGGTLQKTTTTSSSTITLTSGLSVTSGSVNLNTATIAQSGTASALSITGGSVSLTSVTSTFGSGNVSVNGGTLTTSGGSFTTTNSGTFTVGTGTSSAASFTSTTVSINGSLTVNASSAATEFAVTNGSLSVGSTTTVSGGVATLTNSTNTFSNNVSVTSGTLNIDTETAGGTSVTGNMTISGSGNFDLDIGSGITMAVSGTFSTSTSGTINISKGSASSGGTVTATTFTLNNGTTATSTPAISDIDLQVTTLNVNNSVSGSSTFSSTTPAIITGLVNPDASFTNVSLGATTLNINDGADVSFTSTKALIRTIDLEGSTAISTLFITSSESFFLVDKIIMGDDAAVGLDNYADLYINGTTPVVSGTQNNDLTLEGDANFYLGTGSNFTGNTNILVDNNGNITVAGLSTSTLGLTGCAAKTTGSSGNNSGQNCNQAPFVVQGSPEYCVQCTTTEETIFCQTDVSNPQFPTGITSASCLAILPVHYTGTSVVSKAMNSKTVVEVKWGTIMETNNSHFDIERSTNGKDFQVIGTVKAIEGFKAIRAYSYIDNTPIKGVSYYRIKQIDTNGKFNYTEIFSVYITDGLLDQLSLFPNPLENNQLNIKLYTNLENTHINIRIFDLLGKEIKEFTTIQNGTAVTVDFQKDLPPGTYLVQVATANGTTVGKFIK